MASTLNHAFYVYISASWTAITSDVLDGSPRGSWGMMSNRPLDRLAGTGEMTFELKNVTGKYSPGHASMLTGWRKGLPFKWVITFDSRDYIKFYGTIADIQPDPGTKGARRVKVTVLDWMDYATKHPLLSPGYQSSKRADQALNTILGTIPIQPQDKSFARGTITFPALFDTVKTKTTAYKEFSKIVLSEMGYIYVEKDSDTGERLRFESNHTRHGWDALNNIPKSVANSGKLLLETGDYLLLETGDKLVLEESETPSYDNNMSEAEVTYGENVINRMTITAYPKKIDTTQQVLFTLSTPFTLDSGETTELRGNYVDPTGGNSQVSAISDEMQTPVATTDYLMNTLEDGTGTDITSSLTIDAVYGTEGVTYSLTNTYAEPGWITFLQARGKGVYIYNPLEATRKDNDSINEFGYISQNLQQKYNRILAYGIVEANKILEREKEPRTVLNKVTFYANRSDTLIFSFLALDIGDLAHIAEDQTGIDAYFYIQGVEFEILSGGMIKFSWIVKEHQSMLSGLSPLAIEFSGGTETDAVNFGYLPAISNLRQRTIAAWIYMDSDVPDTTYYGIVGYGVNYLFIVKQGRKLKLYVQQVGVAFPGGGAWITTSAVITLSTWTHVAVTHDTLDWPNNSAPIIYVNGSSVALTEETAPNNNVGTEAGLEFVIGNAHASNNNYGDCFDGKIADVRVYDRVLTSSEISTLYNSGTPDETLLTNATTGLVFQAFAVRTADLSDYTDATITSDMKVLDNVYGVVGSPNGTPTGRTAP